MIALCRRIKIRITGTTEKSKKPVFTTQYYCYFILFRTFNQLILIVQRLKISMIITEQYFILFQFKIVTLRSTKL
jgi:hypothetical protein